MRILYIYRNKELGPSIRRVFQPVEDEMKKYAEVQSIFLPYKGTSLCSLYKNICYVRHHIKTKGFDIIHITGDVYYLAFFLKNYKVVATVHDLGFYTNFSKWSLRSLMLFFLWIKPLKYCSMVTFISEKSCKEANKIIDLRNTTIIPNAVSQRFISVPKKLNEDKPVVLHVGTAKNKNLDSVIEALAEKRCHLRIIGKLGEITLEKLRQYNIDYSNASNISDDEILEEYKKCDIVSFPSLYEGFGMPIIEGQATGRPVVTSNISPMKDIARESTILVDPTDIDSIRKGFILAMDNYETLASQGLENVKRYSLENVTKQYLQCYSYIVDECDAETKNTVA